MENFKCVDYFQIQWYDPHNFQESLMTTDKIGRHTRNFDIDVKPCMDYVFQVGICTRGHFVMEFQVIASEDWKGTRPDTKVPSEKAKFRVDYTPKVLRLSF